MESQVSILMSGLNKTTAQLYRDCLRLAHHIGSNSAKGRMIKAGIRRSFKANKDVKDHEEIEKLKGDAIRALANYVLAESSIKDGRLKDSMAKFTSDISI